MNTFSKDELKNLTETQKGLCVSIFMPTYRAGAESQQNQIRLRNLLREAEEKLVARGCRLQDAKSLLEPAQSLVGNVLFWRQQKDGLAIFAAAGIFRRYCLPAAFPELAVVDDRFHLKPLLPVLSSEGRFYILALSQNGVRILEGSAFSAAEVDLETIPKNLADALQLDQPERQVRFRAGSAGGQGTMISGHGADIEDSKDNILKYFRQVDKGLRDFLKEERVPLILAGVEYLLPIYKEANTYPHLVGEGIPGNPKGMNVDQLYKAAWQIVNAHLREGADRGDRAVSSVLRNGFDIEPDRRNPVGRPPWTNRRAFRRPGHAAFRHVRHRTERSPAARNHAARRRRSARFCCAPDRSERRKSLRPCAR